MSIAPIFVLTSVLTAVFFASNNIILKVGQRGNTPVFLGLVFRAIPTIPIILITSYLMWGIEVFQPYWDLKILGLLFFSSSLIVTGDFVFMYALRYHPVKIVAPALAVNPLITLIWLVASDLEPVTLPILIGALVIIGGVMLVTRRDAAGEELSLKGVGFGLIVAFFFGTMGFVDTYTLSLLDTNGFTYNGLKIVGLGGIAALLYMVGPYRSAYAKENSEDKRKTFQYLLLSGIVSWVFGASFMFISFDNAGAAIPAPIINTHPMLSVVFAVILGLERLNRSQGFGIILTLIGTIILLQ